MEDSREEVSPEELTSTPAAPIPPDVEPQPDDDVIVPKFLLSINTAHPKNEDIE